MQRDIRQTPLYLEAEALYRSVRQPGTGQISDAADLNASPDGRYIVFSGAIVDRLEGSPPTHICRTELATGTTQVLTFGPHSDRLPKYSPDGRYIAFLSDRSKSGDFKLYLLDAATGAAHSAPLVDGWIEYLQWSHEGKRILLGVAGHGADIAGGHGSGASSQAPDALPSWTPRLDSGDEAYRWRCIWIFDIDANQVHRIGPLQLNVWQAAWCGPTSIVAVTSPGPGEGLWYSARLHLLDLESGESRELYAPRDQLGWPAASPSGSYIAVVDAVSSDRWIVAGDLVLIDAQTGHSQLVDTAGVDVTHLEWRSEELVLLAGHRSFDTVVGHYNPPRGAFIETWMGREQSIAGRYATVAGLQGAGDCAFVAEGFNRAPELAVVRGGNYRSIRSFDLGYRPHAAAIETIEPLSWQAPDGLEIQGWLLTPRRRPPHRLIMNIHGGPVWQIRPLWLGRLSAAMLMLLAHGYAVFYPNPRGSTGRGREFTRRIVGDMGGAEMYDNLSGIDHLLARGLADPGGLGVTGGSHGGYMTAWLIGHDTRFAAAVPVVPVINWVSEHLISNIPHFVAMFLNDHYTRPNGRYFERSPLMYAHRVRTPTLSMCGALDRCTPPEEAMQFHQALLENGVESALLTYPEEGHGVYKFPAAFDFAARMVGWFERHIPADRSKPA